MTRGNIARLFTNLLVICVVIYFSLIALMYFTQRKMMYFPIGINAAPADVVEFHATKLAGRDYAPTGWFIMPESKDDTIIIHFHGNGGNLASRYWEFKSLADHGYGLLFAEYTGYNGNAGKPTKTDLLLDADGYYQALIAQGYNVDNIAVIGESIGSGPASYIAGKYNISALILQVPYDSLLAVVKDKYPFIIGIEYLLKDNFDNIASLQNYQGRSLIMLAEHDEVVPFARGLNLYEALEEPKMLHVFKGARHVDFYDSNHLDIILDFLNDR